MLKLVYYNDELKGYEHKLAHLSSFAKGEIDLAECMRRCDVAGVKVRAEIDAKYVKDQREEIAFQFAECQPWSMTSDEDMKCGQHRP